MIEPDAPNQLLANLSVLEMLGLHWHSGKMVVLAGAETYGVQVDAGQIILATSTHRALRLGHLLLQLGAVKPSFLEELFQGTKQLRGTAALGRVLIRAGAISRADLASGVEEQCVEVLSRVMELTGATFLHVMDDPLPAGIEIIPMATDRLLQAALVRSDNRSAVRAMQLLLPSADRALMVTIVVARFAHLLTDSEALVAVRVEQGLTTLDALCSHLPLDPLTVKRALIGLMERGYIAIRPAT